MLPADGTEIPKRRGARTRNTVGLKNEKMLGNERGEEGKIDGDVGEHLMRAGGTPLKLQNQSLLPDRKTISYCISTP